MPSVRHLSFAFVAAAAAAALAIAPPAAARRTIRLKVPRFVVPPHTDREVCTFVRVPMKKALDLGGSVIVNVGGHGSFTTHHFLMWVYEGKDINRFPPKGQLVDSKACLDFGPTDTNRRTLIGGAQQPRLKTRLPAGLAQQIKPTVSGGQSVAGIILNSHWINGEDTPQKAAVKITLMAAPRHSVRQFLLPLFDVVANGFLKVPPMEQESVGSDWSPGGFNFGGSFGGGAFPSGPACVVALTSHMHKRGALFTIEFFNGNTTVECGDKGMMCLTATDYADPPQVQFTPPLLVKVGQGLHYTCTHDNGVNDRPIKMGCEEEAGVIPGVDAATALFSGRGTTGAAKRCEADADCPATDPAYPKRTFTGKCVPANLVFGFTSDDDMCIMPGAWYPANAAGSCDVSGLPLLN